MTTLKSINSIINKAGYELKQGNDFYYYTPIQNDRPDLQQNILNITNLDEYTNYFIIDDLTCKLETTLNDIHDDLLNYLIQILKENNVEHE